MIYVSSACITKKKISEVLTLYAQNGMKAIELSGGTMYYDGIETDLAQGKNMYGLQYACHAYFPPEREDFVVNLASCNDWIFQKSKEHYRRCIELLARLKCEILSVHAGFFVEIRPDQVGKTIYGAVRYDKKEAYHRFCSAYKELVTEAGREGITVYLENNVISRRNYESFGKENYFMMTDWQSICEMRKHLDFHLLLDIAHLYVSSHTLGFDYKQQVRKLCAQTKWIHVSENDGTADQHLPLKADSDIVRALGYLKRRRPDVNITLETAGEISSILSSCEIVKSMGEKV